MLIDELGVREDGNVDPNRLVVAPALPAAEHLADLFVDSYPVTAHTTASDSL
jgi:predicted O-linked N-acetylglucosamine transferase (SPINDLY family)